jgi:hypothetical protein
MNRRSILSSLSSMFLAALAWPRQADAGDSIDPKAPKYAYSIRVYNGLYINTGRTAKSTANRTAAAGQLVPGQATLNVQAYSQNPFITLLPGVPEQFTQRRSYTPFDSTFYAKNGNAASSFNLRQTYPETTMIYLLVNASGTAAPTITRAPPGVTF